MHCSKPFANSLIIREQLLTMQQLSGNKCSRLGHNFSWVFNFLKKYIVDYFYMVVPLQWTNPLIIFIQWKIAIKTKKKKGIIGHDCLKCPPERRAILGKSPRKMRPRKIRSRKIRPRKIRPAQGLSKIYIEKFGKIGKFALMKRH